MLSPDSMLILEIIKQLIPDINLIPIKKMQVAETINIYLHLNQRDATKLTAVITPHNSPSENTHEDSSIVILPKSTQQLDQFKAIVSKVPFSSGSHLIIDQPSFWKQPCSNVSLGSQLQICPILFGEPLLIRTPKEQRFEVELDREGVLLVEIWSGEQIRVDTRTLVEPQVELASRSKWTFETYSPKQIVRFKEEETLSQIILSFDPDIVREVILIKRERNYERNFFGKEYYILVSRV